MIAYLLKILTFFRKKDLVPRWVWSLPLAYTIVSCWVAIQLNQAKKQERINAIKWHQVSSQLKIQINQLNLETLPLLDSISRLQKQQQTIRINHEKYIQKLSQMSNRELHRELDFYLQSTTSRHHSIK